MDDAKQTYIAGAAQTVELYRAYRAAVVAHPYDPVAAASAYNALRDALAALSAAARSEAGAAILREAYEAAAVERAARALPLAEGETLRLLAHVRVLLEAGATVDELTTAMSRAVGRSEQ